MDKDVIRELYVSKKESVSSIARKLKCSEGRVNYWIGKHGIQKRSISEAMYTKHNPNGDPFVPRTPQTIAEGILYGIGIGLYWGEGTKSNKYSVRLGNTDPYLIKSFIKFLEVMYTVDKSKLRFGLQIFSDMSPVSAKKFWVNALHVSPKQFHKIIVTPSRGVGTYRKKVQHGVLTVYFSNKKLRDVICEAIENAKKMR